MKENIKLLISDIKKQCKNDGVKFRMVKSDMVDSGDGVLCNGYFCDVDMELVVATKKPKKEWLMILLHEYSHFLQYVKKKKFWNDSKMDSFDVWGWIVNKKMLVSVNKVRKGVNMLKYLELDCEKSVIRLINKYGLKDYISKDDYIRKANSYVLFYNYVRKNRVWYKKPPYSIPEVYLNMSNKFDMNYSRLTKKQSELFKLCL